MCVCVEDRGEGKTPVSVIKRKTNEACGSVWAGAGPAISLVVD